MLKNNDWQPTASFEYLKARAACLAKIRDFFNQRGVLEVETPLLCHTATTDPHLVPISTKVDLNHLQSNTYYLQTSPEFSMKRLLAHGSGSIYQICKAFRAGEVGRIHNPEFTMLEWYRLGFDHYALMDEIDALLNVILGTKPAERFSYKAVFEKFLDFNPHSVSLSTLKTCAQSRGIVLQNDIMKTLTVDDWLDIFMTHCIEPHLGFDCPVFIDDFPVSKAALAKIRDGNPPVAERFELYVRGTELANGYHELTHAKKQLMRMQSDNAYRKALGKPAIPIDYYLIHALEAGLPDCAGVALGFDRLFMLQQGCDNIQSVIAFDIDRA